MKIEEAFQAECVMWVNENLPLHRNRLYCIPNKSANKIEGAKHKSMGVKRGPSDLFFVSDILGIVWLECKLENGVQSKEQKAFQQQVESAGCVYAIFRDLEEFKTIIYAAVGL